MVTSVPFKKNGRNMAVLRGGFAVSGECMHRRRRQAVQIKVYAPRKLDTPVFMAAYSQVAEKWLDWHGRRMTVRHAEAMVVGGEAEVFTRKTDNGLIRVYRETKPSRASQPTPCTLTLRTMLAVARRGESDLSGGERREIAKLVLWPFEHDRLNPSTVGPRVSDSERAAAQAMLDRARGVNVLRPGRGKAEVQALYLAAPAQGDCVAA